MKKQICNIRFKVLAWVMMPMLLYCVAPLCGFIGSFAETYCPGDWNNVFQRNVTIDLQVQVLQPKRPISNMLCLCASLQKTSKNVNAFHNCSPFSRQLLQQSPWCKVEPKKLSVAQVIKKFSAFHGTRIFTAILTRVRHLSLSWASWIQSILT
jgi:hypothetical protein